MIFGDRLKNEDAKLLEKINKKKIKVLRVSSPSSSSNAVTQPQPPRNILQAGNMNNTSNSTAIVSNRLSETSCNRGNNEQRLGDSDDYREGSDLEHSSDSSDNDDNDDNDGDGGDGGDGGDSDDDDDGDILFNLLNLASRQGGTRVMRDEDVLASSHGKSSMKVLSDNINKLSSNYDKCKRSYQKISLDMKREVEKIKAGFVPKEDFEELRKEILELKDVIINLRVSITQGVEQEGGMRSNSKRSKKTK